MGKFRLTYTRIDYDQGVAQPRSTHAAELDASTAEEATAEFWARMRRSAPLWSQTMTLVSVEQV